MQLIVTGGRDFRDYDFMCESLDYYEKNNYQINVVIHGGADGADKLASAWAADHGVVSVCVPCTTEMWNLMDMQAGNIRNRQMLQGNPHAIVAAFPGPKSRGTWNCMRDAVRFKMKVDLFIKGKPDQLNWKH